MRIGVFSQAASLNTATLEDVVAEAKAFEAQGFAFLAYPSIFGFPLGQV